MNIETFNEHINRLSNSLFRFAYWRLGIKEVAEDCVQDTFMKLWLMGERIDSYSNIDGLAFKVLRNLCIDISRKKEIIELDISSMNEQFVSNISPQRRMEIDEELYSVEKAIMILPEQQQTIFFMKMIEGYKTKEIAEIMNLKINTVEVNLSRARKKINEELQISHHGK